MSKLIMGNDGFRQGSSTKKCIHALSFPLAKYREPQLSNAK